MAANVVAPGRSQKTSPESALSSNKGKPIAMQAVDVKRWSSSSGDEGRVISHWPPEIFMGSVYSDC
jgi:hypothetical protein